MKGVKFFKIFSFIIGAFVYVTFCSFSIVFAEKTFNVTSAQFITKYNEMVRVNLQDGKSDPAIKEYISNKISLKEFKMDDKNHFTHYFSNIEDVGVMLKFTTDETEGKLIQIDLIYPNTKIAKENFNNLLIMAISKTIIQSIDENVRSSEIVKNIFENAKNNPSHTASASSDIFDCSLDYGAFLVIFDIKPKY